MWCSITWQQTLLEELTLHLFFKEVPTGSADDPDFAVCSAQEAVPLFLFIVPFFPASVMPIDKASACACPAATSPTVGEVRAAGSAAERASSLWGSAGCDLSGCSSALTSPWRPLALT